MTAKARISTAILVALTAALFVSACNTVRGAGRDVQSVGQAVEDVAD